MGTIAKTNTHATGDVVVASEHNADFDTLYTEFNGSIEDANFKAGGGVTDTKLLQISTAAKVSGAAITSLDTMPSGAGNLPGANYADKIVMPTKSELTIAGGEITITQSYHTVDTESDDATDDLVTINGGTTGQFLFLKAAHTDRTVVVKDGTGNVELVGDRSLDSSSDIMILFYTGSVWIEIKLVSV